MWEYFEWCDALAHNPGWTSEEDLLEWTENNSFIVSGFYWVITEDDNQITVAQSKTVDEEFEDTMYNSIYKIPKGWIKKRKVIKNV